MGEAAQRSTHATGDCLYPGAERACRKCAARFVPCGVSKFNDDVAPFVARGKLGGKVLYSLDSIRAYLRGLMEIPCPPSQPAGRSFAEGKPYTPAGPSPQMVARYLHGELEAARAMVEAM